MYQHQFQELASARARDLQRLAERQRLVAACRQDPKRNAGSKKFLSKSRNALRQQGRAAPQH